MQKDVFKKSYAIKSHITVHQVPLQGIVWVRSNAKLQHRYNLVGDVLPVIPVMSLAGEKKKYCIGLECKRQFNFKRKDLIYFYIHLK